MTTLRKRPSWKRLGFVFAVAVLGSIAPANRVFAQKVEVIDVEGQPLAANAERLQQALQLFGAPLTAETAAPLEAATKARDAKKIQQLLDPHVLVVVTLNPESRVKAARGPAKAS